MNAKMKRLFLCFLSAIAPNCRSESTIPAVSERSVRYVHLSFAFSEESAWSGEEDFNVCGLSAGIGFDLVPGRMAGLQLAGLVAAVDHFQGIQTSLLMPLAKRGEGLQLSPVCSWTQERFTGLQLAGIGNVASGVGVQAALGFNASDDAFNIGSACLNNGRESNWSGLQLAGISNQACYLDGVQLSLCYNYAVRCHGLQVAFRNDAEELHGAQIGLINTAHAGAGIQIGLINSFGHSGDGLVLPFVNARF